MKGRPKIPPKFLRELWKQIPAMKNCQGKCAISCGPLPLDEDSVERELVEQRAGKRLETVGANCQCAMLDRNGRCTVYSIRPTLCRLWGVVESMPCPHGCEPERWLTDEEGFKLLGEALGGNLDVSAAFAAMTPKDRELFYAFIRQGDDLAERSPLYRDGMKRGPKVDLVVE